MSEQTSQFLNNKMLLFAPLSRYSWHKIQTQHTLN